jgi:hypothetical protein
MYEAVIEELVQLRDSLRDVKGKAEAYLKQATASWLCRCCCGSSASND